MSDAASDDPFALLDLPRRFDLEDHRIEQAYLTRAAALHPDRFNDPLQQADAVRQSARINDARRTLLDQESRAGALLRLFAGEQHGASDALPDGFLMEILDVREEMEADFGDADRRQHWEDWARAERRQYLDRIGRLFSHAREGALPAEAAQAIRCELNALRYIERMIEQLDPAYDHAAELRRARPGGSH